MGISFQKKKKKKKKKNEKEVQIPVSIEFHSMPVKQVLLLCSSWELSAFNLREKFSTLLA